MLGHLLLFLLLATVGVAVVAGILSLSDGLAACLDAATECER